MIGSVILVNILIAMMDHTQEITNERSNEWLRQVKLNLYDHYFLNPLVIKLVFSSGANMLYV